MEGMTGRRSGAGKKGPEEREGRSRTVEGRDASWGGRFGAAERDAAPTAVAVEGDLAELGAHSCGGLIVFPGKVDLEHRPLAEDGQLLARHKVAQ